MIDLERKPEADLRLPRQPVVDQFAKDKEVAQPLIPARGVEVRAVRDVDDVDVKLERFLVVQLEAVPAAQVELVEPRPRAPLDPPL
jgi:hypothetical protein